MSRDDDARLTASRPVTGTKAALAESGDLVLTIETGEGSETYSFSPEQSEAFEEQIADWNERRENDEF